MKSNNVVLTSAQRGASTGLTNMVNASSYEYAIITIYMTAKSGAPTLQVSLQCSPVDPLVDSTKWRTVYAEELITNTMIGSSFPKIFGAHRQEDFSGWLRVWYQVAGATTPKLTFSVNIELK